MGRYLYILFMLLYVNIAASSVIPCKGLVCMHGGNCTISPFGEPYCKCSPKFYGKTCDMIKENPCQLNKCMNSAVCNVTKDYNSFTCECQNGYAGELCEEKVNIEKYKPEELKEK
uniref:EGF-like domain-containing protein n=1 Tax=Panagrolaimus sp. PS1159 TaxID=55785 RepID=A0AC35GMS6_9BILA